MYKRLAALYHKLSGFPPVAWAGNRYLDGLPLGNLLAYLRVRKYRKNRIHQAGPIVVVFVQQHKANWDIVRNLYERMVEDESFKPYLVSVEEPNDDDHDAVHRLLVGLYGAENVIKAEDGESLFDLRSLDPDYVFLPRPYDQYLPKQYRSSTISKYTSVSYIPYGINFIKTVERDAMLGRFFRNVSMFFADSSYTAALERVRHPKSHAEGIRYSIESGLPYLSSFVRLRDSKPDAFRVLWTPRWGEEAHIGGSSFLAFKDLMLERMENNLDEELTFRPHPYTFEHFVKTGRMTKEDVSEYLSNFERNVRLEYDDSPDLNYSFMQSSVLVTDISSIIAPYLITGKPIVFCETGAKLNMLGRKLLESMYVAGSFEEVNAHVDNIKRGVDPLYDLRIESVKEQFFHAGEDSTGIIMHALVKDCLGKD